MNILSFLITLKLTSLLRSAINRTIWFDKVLVNTLIPILQVTVHYYKVSLLLNKFLDETKVSVPRFHGA